MFFGRSHESQTRNDFRSQALLNASMDKRNSLDPCFISELPSKNTNTEIVRFPVLSRETSMPGALLSKTPYMQMIPISSQYTPYEWTQMNLLQYNDADTKRNSSERLRSDATRLLR